MAHDATITLSLDNLGDASDPAPLYHRYPRQTGPQPAYVYLSEDGKVDAQVSGEIGGGTPERVYHDRTLRWSVPADVRGPVLADLLEGEALPLLERIHAGHSVHWDGSNHRGRLDADAQAASDELERLLEQLQDEGARVSVWLAGDWLFGGCTLRQHWDTQTLDEAVAELQATAQRDGVVIDGDLRAELLAEADRRFDPYGDDDLTPAHLAALVADGRITSAQVDGRDA